MAVLTPYDLTKSDVLTRSIMKRLPQDQIDAIYDCSALAPIRQIRERSVKLGIREPDLTQIGQFRALNSQTPLITTRYQTGIEQEIELAILAEKELVHEDVMMNLRSPDGRVAQEAVANILNAGVRLQKRNINLSRWMVWKAAQDNLTVTLNTGAFNVDYDFDNSRGGMKASHTPPNPAPLWSDPSADIIGNIETWSKLIIDDSGARPTDLWVSDKTWKYMQKNTQIQIEFGGGFVPIVEGYQMRLARPQQTSQVAAILGLQNIYIYDSTYRDASNVTQRYFPENKVLLIAPTIDGVRTFELLDGPVSQFDSRANDIRITNNPGMRAEIWTSPDPPMKNIRVSTSRMPVVMREAVVLATVW